MRDENVDDSFPRVAASSGDRIDIFSPVNSQYYSGEFTMVHGGKHQGTYDASHIEELDLSQETWHFGSTTSESCTVSTSRASKLKSSMRDDLQHMFERFGNKVFLVNHAQGFSSYILQRAYAEKK